MERQKQKNKQKHKLEEGIKNTREFTLCKYSLSLHTFEFSLNVFTEFAKFSNKKICKNGNENLQPFVLPQSQHE